MRLLFVFVILSSVAFGQISTSSVDFGQQTAKQPNCKDIDGVEESAKWKNINTKTTQAL